MKLTFTVIALLFVSMGVYAQEMPIVGYMGVPRTESTASRYLEMQECGFNTNLATFSNEEQLLQALHAADSVGMKLIPYFAGFFENPEKFVPLVDGYASLMAYMVCDEPYLKDLPTVRSRMDGINKAGATKPCYVNLHPYYGPRLYTSMGLSSYDEYVSACVSALDMPFISFDHYPIIHTDSIRVTWYENMDIIRAESLKSHKPIWAFVECSPHLVYDNPTVEQLRLQINVDLAYGAQAIQYYTYWHPEDPYNTYYDTPVDINGNRTSTYETVKQANEELKQIAPLFYNGKITKVQHVDTKFSSATIVKSDLGALCSLLTTQDGKKYVVIVNKSPKKNMEVRHRGKDYDVKPGGMLLLER